MFKKIVVVSLAALSLAACADKGVYSGDVYKGSEAKAERAVSYGTLVSVRPVTIQADKTGLGAVSGAAIGGVAGNAMGGGRGRNVTTAVGAVLGGLVGDKIEQTSNRVNSVELEIRRDSGETIVVVQSQGSTMFVPGQRVRMSGTGRSMNVSVI